MGMADMFSIRDGCREAQRHRCGTLGTVAVNRWEEPNGRDGDVGCQGRRHPQDNGYGDFWK